MKYNLSSFSIYTLTSFPIILFNNYYDAQCSWLLSIYSSGNLHASLVTSNFLPLLCFITHTQPFLMHRASVFVHMRHSSFLVWVTRKVYLAKILTKLVGYARKEDVVNLGLSIPFDRFSAWPRVTMEG